jgi:nucleoside 2-deoxyribosyltransferase
MRNLETKIYLASRYQDHPLMREWRDLLASRGFVVVARWIEGNHEISGVDDDKERVRFAQEDLADIQACDIVIMRSDPSFFRSGRGGRHVELGLAIAWGKRIVLVGERENVFHWLPQIDLVHSIASAISILTDEQWKRGKVNA